MGGRVLGSLSVLTLVALYATLGRDAGAAAVLAPVALLPLAVRGQVRLGLPAQAVLSFALLGLGALLTRVLPGPSLPFRGVMGPLVPFVAMGSILLAGSRLFLREPAGGDRATVAQGFWCLVVCGAQRSGLVYVLGCALYLALAGAWLRGGRSWARGRHARWWALSMALGAALAGGLAWAVPVAHVRVVRWLADTATQTGLQDGPLELGSLAGLAQSDRVVARVFGLRGSTLLRGVVYQDYSRGRWLGNSTLIPRPQPVAGAGGPIEIRYEPVDLPRFLLPLGARSVALSASPALVDGFGVFSPVYGTSIEYARYDEGPRDLFAPEPALPADLQLPGSLRGGLTALARRWVGEETDPAAQVERLAQALVAHHPYSLHFERPPRRDPIVSFLATEGAAGHCEYFASALALLARSLGVPARVVGGYRVSEYNAVGRYHVVRERNAHAWAEVQLPGQGWVSVDATPAESVDLAGPAQTPRLTATLDALLTHGASALRRAVDRPALVATPLGLALAWLVGRDTWRRWRGRRQGVSDRDRAPFDPPPAHLQALLRRLEDRGLRRPPAETLEALARRLEADRSGDEAAGLLRRYADLRYGGLGDDARLRADIERYLALAPAPPARGR